jgi:hypothetical protein
MSVGEAHPLRGEFVEVGRGDLAARRIIRADVAVAEVVGEDDEDIRLTRFGGAEGQRTGEERE